MLILLKCDRIILFDANTNYDMIILFHAYTDHDNITLSNADADYCMINTDWVYLMRRPQEP